MLEPHNKTALTEQDELEIVRLYTDVEPHWSYDRICGKYKIGPTRLRRILEKNDVEIDPQKYIKRTPEKTEAVLALREKNVPSIEIAKQTGLGASTIRRILSARGLSYSSGPQKRDDVKEWPKRLSFYQRAVCVLGSDEDLAFCLHICNDDCQTAITAERGEAYNRYWEKHDRIAVNDVERAKAQAVYQAMIDRAEWEE